MAEDKLNNRLKRFRSDAGSMTQEELADKVGVTRQTIIAIEQGKYCPSLSLAMKIARVFSVRIEEIFYFEDEKMDLDRLREFLTDEIKKVFGDDNKRIEHALKVYGFCEQLTKEEGGNKEVITAAGLLHDIGIKAAEEKYGSSAGKFQEIEGPAIAREILDKTELSENDKEHVCKIVGSHHSAKDIDTIEFRILWDADWLVNIPEEHKDLTDEQLKNLAGRVFKTKTGRALAEELFG